MAYHDEYLELISAGLDGALTSEERARLDAHLAVCPDCKALYDQIWVAAKAVKGLPPVEPPADLTDRIMAAVSRDNVIPITAGKRKQPWRKWIASAAAVALLLLGGFGMSHLRMGSSKSIPMSMEAASTDNRSIMGPTAGDGAKDTEEVRIQTDGETTQEMMESSMILESLDKNKGLVPPTGDGTDENGTARDAGDAVSPASGTEGESTPPAADAEPSSAAESETVYGELEIQSQDELTGMIIPNSIDSLPGQKVEMFAVTGLDRILEVTVNGQTFELVLNDGPAAMALCEALPLTLEMTERDGGGKYASLEETIPTQAEAVGEVHTGDLMLLDSNCLVLFYDSFPTAQEYTPLGSIADLTGFAEALDTGDVTVTFSMK